MKNPKSKSNKINIIFSSFLVIGYIICTYFFSSIAGQISGVWGKLIQILIMVLFGLLLFYATRVGEGKQVKRFSLAVLLLIDLPALYLILASFVPGMPLHDFITPPVSSMMAMMGATANSGPSIILMLSCVALGYGIPYTFFAGYELKEEGDEEAVEEEPVVEGGLAEELAEIEKAEEASEEAVDAEAAEEAAEEATEEATEEAAEEAADKAEDTEESEKEAE